MTEPWMDVRERVEKARRHVDDGWPAWNWHVHSLEDAERLLADADALLVFKDAAMGYIAGNPRDYAMWLHKIREAHAALPEHLKG